MVAAFVKVHQSVHMHENAIKNLKRLQVVLMKTTPFMANVMHNLLCILHILQEITFQNGQKFCAS